MYGASGVSDVNFLSLEYLLNFKKSSIDLGPMYGASTYASFSARAALSLVDKKEKHLNNQCQVLALPPPQKIEKSFDSLIRERRSHSEMSGEPLTLGQLSTLLFYGDGVTGDKTFIDPVQDESWPSMSLGEPDPYYVRSAPSGGALYPIDLYLLVSNVDQLENGLYRYRPNSHSLINVRPLSDDDWDAHKKDAATWGDNIHAEKFNITIFYVYSLFKNSRKYGDLGLAFGFIEIGMIAQNIHLAAQALGLASNCIGGGSKVMRERFLNIDGQSQHCLHQMIIGQPG
ncbi:hypothetical protein AB835_07695 [Candidatus Endobugula sertula]|uniref:Nitroreductase domain-containing protein n=1 Tax=Candidatus Endobugula sertula TaxID=62101 RepID=A0A1D2QQ40_9GAMM|nr:hypothetical protein AB835_07695 [Candidatus Endobugula sertula]